MERIKQSPGGPIDCAQCRSVLEWLKGEHVSEDGAEFTLPPEFAHLSATGTASALRTRDGRHCVLLKVSIGWKDNFEGMFCSESPLHAFEIIGDGTDREYISIGDQALFQELYIRRKHSDTCFTVYFDLN
jgi:hypothetical protein